ncbi:MAG: hypothetical protein ACK4UU_09915, partial [Fimbriimonadales bacterium]
MSIGASELRALHRLWRASGDPRRPFRDALVTPIFMGRKSLDVIRGWREDGVIENLYFDSGGFYVQMGRISYRDLCEPLLELYTREQWADH